MRGKFSDRYSCINLGISRMDPFGQNSIIYNKYTYDSVRPVTQSSSESVGKPITEKLIPKKCISEFLQYTHSIRTELFLKKKIISACLYTVFFKGNGTQSGDHSERCKLAAETETI